MILVSIQIFSSFWYWSNMEVSGNTSYSFSVYCLWSMEIRIFLVALLVGSSFCLGDPGVDLENAKNSPDLFLIWARVVRG